MIKTNLTDMKLLFLLLFPFICFSQDVWVKGHYRTRPNNTINDNYSTVGNINPYTGKAGTVPFEIIYYTYPSIPTDYPLKNPPKFDAKGIADLAVPVVKPVYDEPVPLKDDSKTDLPDDYKPENKYFFEKSVAAPVKPALEEKVYKTLPEKETKEDYTEEIFLSIMGVIAVLMIIFIQKKP